MKPKFANWGQAASRERDQLTEWWDKDKQALPALLTGSKSRLTVLDVDVKNGKPGFRNLKALGGLPQTFTVITSSGRLHLYFRTPHAITTAIRQASLGDGVDACGEGSFVIAPGTIMPDGLSRYCVYSDIAPAELPGTLAARLFTTHKTDPGGAQEALSKICIELAATTRPRSGALRRAAQLLAPYVREDLLGEAEVYRALHNACSKNGAIEQSGEDAFKETVRNGLSLGWEFKPGRVPEQNPSFDEAPPLADRIEEIVRQLRGQERVEVITAKYRAQPEAQFLRGLRNAMQRRIYELDRDGRHEEARLMTWLAHFSDNQVHRSQASALTLSRIMGTSHQQIVRYLHRLEDQGLIASGSALDDGQACYVIVPIEQDFTGIWQAPLWENKGAIHPRLRLA